MRKLKQISIFSLILFSSFSSAQQDNTEQSPTLQAYLLCMKSNTELEKEKINRNIESILSACTTEFEDFANEVPSIISSKILDETIKQTEEQL